MDFSTGGPAVEVCGSGPPVCLVPDFARDRAQWSAQTPVLARRYSVLLVDSDSNSSVSTLARTVGRALADRSLGPAVVAGSGMGASVALEIARHGPGRVCGLVLVSPDADAGRLEATATVKVPALVVAGTNGLLGAVANAERTAARLVNARLELVKGAANEPMVEARARFNELLLGFLHQVTGGEAA